MVLNGKKPGLKPSEENIRGFYQQLVEAINKYGLQPNQILQC